MLAIVYNEISQSMFSRALILWLASRNWKKKKKTQPKSFHSQYIQEILNKYKRHSLSQKGYGKILFQMYLCFRNVFDHNSIFHSFEKHALTRLSLIFKILEQPQSKMIFLKSRVDSYKQALLTYQFTGSQRLLCYLQFLTSCFWTLKLKRNASYFFLLLSFP